MADKTQKEMIQETHQTMVELKTVLLGVPGTADGGLVQEVKSVKVSVCNLDGAHGKLKRNFWLLVGILAGSGVLAGGVYGLLNGGF